MVGPDKTWPEGGAPGQLRFEYAPSGSDAATAGNVLLSVGFRAAGPCKTSGLDVRVPLDVLGGPVAREFVTTEESVRIEEACGFRLAVTDESLAGARESSGGDIERETFRAYGDLLNLIEDRNLHLHRVWNVLPDLNGGPPSFDRYMRFCRGRSRAFNGCHGEGFESRLCATSAVGADSGPQVLYFIAGRERGTPIENPRQVSAYRYPRQYGPRSPAFARAMATEGCLFVSGTASIVGHASIHTGDVRAQTRETFANLRVVAAAGGRGLSMLKVYLRRREDLADVAAVVSEVSPESELLVLRADLCRRELLVEIEGVGSSFELREARR